MRFHLPQFQDATDPVTGDHLTRLEYLTRQIQVVVRTPWFLLAFNIVTLVALRAQHGDWWNLFASWLAIVIEWLVGTYMFGQTKRDALCLREIRANSERIEQIAELVLKDVEVEMETLKVTEEGGAS